jgi:hypothetical protein
MNNRNKISLSIVCIVLLGVAAWAIWPDQVLAEAMQGQEMHKMQGHDMHKMKPSPQKDEISLKMVHANLIPGLSLSIEKAILAVKAGEDGIALSELQKAQTLLEAVKKAVSQKVQPTIVNSKCPIMGGTINPDKISDSLVRDFKGQKVAFCCGGCPGQWDKLSDAEKEAKLSKVVTEKPSSQKHDH